MIDGNSNEIVWELLKELTWVTLLQCWVKRWCWCYGWRVIKPCGVLCIDPVSYTHLDVYKRQNLTLTSSSTAIWRFALSTYYRSFYINVQNIIVSFFSLFSLLMGLIITSVFIVEIFIFSCLQIWWSLKINVCQAVSLFEITIMSLANNS